MEVYKVPVIYNRQLTPRLDDMGMAGQFTKYMAFPYHIPLRGLVGRVY